jgi:xanthine dehydrogenase YagT iron-sulfur-binding subunit
VDDERRKDDDERHKDERPARGMTRRDFFARGAASVVTAGLLPGALAEAGPETAAPAAGTGALLGPGPVPLTLRVNGQSHALRLEPRVTLLDALRNHLDLTGAKKVCDRATCGACTVLLGGQPVYSCSVLAVEAVGREVLTVEGLGSPERMHPIQAAFVANDAQQCGFCTPGFVMAVKALLDRSPRPTPEAIAQGLGGNLCRCGTYDGIRRAVADAGIAMSKAGYRGTRG